MSTARSMTTDSRAPRTATGFRDAIAEVISDPDHEQCRAAGPVDEANCIAEGLFHRGFRAEAAADPVARLREAAPQYRPCPTRIRPGYDEPSDWPWRYAHAASIEGAHWNIYTAIGDINRDYFIGMVEYEVEAKSIVDQHNAALPTPAPEEGEGDE